MKLGPYKPVPPEPQPTEVENSTVVSAKTKLSYIKFPNSQI